MRSTPARMLRGERPDQPGQLLVERFGVHKIRKVEYLPHNTVTVQMTHQVTGAWATRNLRWDEQVTTEEPFEVKIGETGTVRVELALLADEEERPIYRYRLIDEAAEIDHEGADLYLGASHRPDNTKAMESLLSFLGASAESWAAGHASEADLFPEDVNVWAANKAGEITIAAMELSEGLER